MALPGLPATLKTVLRASLAVTLPVLLTGCGESAGDQGSGGAALFSVPPSPSPSPSPSSGPTLLGSLSVLPPAGGGSGGSTTGGVPSGSASGVITSGVITTPGFSPVTLQPRPTDSVPGPLPVLGAAAAFGCSRRLRRRIRRGR